VSISEKVNSYREDHLIKNVESSSAARVVNTHKKYCNNQYQVQKVLPIPIPITQRNLLQ